MSGEIADLECRICMKGHTDIGGFAEITDKEVKDIQAEGKDHARTRERMIRMRHRWKRKPKDGKEDGKPRAIKFHDDPLLLRAARRESRASTKRKYGGVARDDRAEQPLAPDETQMPSSLQ